MPMRNAAPYLSKAIDSILSQSYRDFELLVVDDGSVDHSAQILASYSDPRIRQIRNDSPRGIEHALNRGWREAWGEFVARMDADDLSLPKRLERQVAFMDANPSVTACGTWLSLTGSRNGVWRYASEHEEIRCRLLFSSAMAHATVMFRKDPLDRLGEIYSTGYLQAEDYALWVRLAQHHRLANLSEVLYQYRFHEGQSGHREPDVRQTSSDRIRRELLAQLDLHPSHEELLIHAAIARTDLDPSLATLEEAEAWLLKLDRANQTVRIYDQAVFRRVLGSYWWAACYRAGRSGVRTWPRFARSPLRDDSVVPLRQRLRLRIKSWARSGSNSA